MSFKTPLTTTSPTMKMNAIIQRIIFMPTP